VPAQGESKAPLALFTLLSVSLVALAAGLAAIYITGSLREAERVVEARATGAVRAAAAHANWVIEANFQALKRISATLSASLPLAPHGNADIRSIVGHLPPGVYVWVFDKTGRSIYSNEPEYDPYDAVGRDYFEAPRRGSDRTISPLMVGRASKRKQFVLSLPIRKDGQFLGVAAVFIPADVLSGVWTELDLGEQSTVGLIRDDGHLVARYPLPSGPIDLSTHPLFRQLLPASAQGTYLSEKSPADGTARLVAYKKIENLPLVAVVGATSEPWKFLSVSGQTNQVAFVATTTAALVFVCAALLIVFRNEVEAKAALTRALGQNELLLREVYHRVKNNLQTISALVRLQPGLPAAKEALFSRISAIAKAHELICEAHSLGDVEVDHYMRAIVGAAAVPIDRQIDITWDLSPLRLHVDRAIPLGLIVNEVVCNAAKHAFQGRQRGRLDIALKPLDGGRAVIVIADDGIGRSAHAQAGVGRLLIDRLCEQIEATWRYEDGAGTTFILEFPLQASPSGYHAIR